MPAEPLERAETVARDLVGFAGCPPTRLKELADLMEEAAVRLGLSQASLWRISRFGQPSDPVLLLGHDDPEWRETYDREGFLHVDPVIQLVFRFAQPFTWSEAEKLRQDDLTQRLFEARRAKRSQDAVICPVFGPFGERGCVAFLSGELLNLSATTRIYLSCIANVIATMFRDINQDQDLPTTLNPVLSRRESECLFWLSSGKSASDTGSILGLSPHTVRGYIESAMTKLGASSRDELVLKAFPMGLLTSHR